tara:strand:- start:487 stop:1443 length:957 start_codon:yes stop_codon:yes gene_type:complete
LDYKEFVVELSKLINNQNSDNQINENIFGPDERFNRGKILFDQITLLGKILNVFKFKNQIISIDNKFYIKVDGINLQIVSPYFLKGVGEEVHTSAKKICDMLDHFKKKPEIIIDIGSCWGETSLYFAKRYVGSTVFSIEGSIDNFVIQLENKIKQDFKTENLYIDNLVISNKNGSAYITNGIGTMHQVQNYNSTVANLVKVKAQTLTRFFQEKNIDYADVIKIDIEGHEPKLINDLLTLDIRSLFIEVGSLFHPIEISCNFLLALSKKFEIIDIDTYEKIVVDDLTNYLSEKVIANPRSQFDLFLKRKRVNINKEIEI